jgi:hypothetical protein
VSDRGTTERVNVHQIESLDDLAAERMRERERKSLANLSI